MSVKTIISYIDCPLADIKDSFAEGHLNSQEYRVLRKMIIHCISFPGGIKQYKQRREKNYFFQNFCSMNHVTNHQSMIYLSGNTRICDL